MDHEQAFLQAVCEHPEDDALRLVFADWLDEHGEADRAEFIRLQCRMPGRYADREQQLLHAHKAEWTFPLRQVVPALRDDDVRFARGFPSGVTLRSSEALTQAERLVEAAPLREVRLDLGGSVIDAQTARAFFASPSLGKVTYVYLGGNHLGAEGARDLAESPHWRRLTDLSLPLNAIGDAGASALAGSVSLHNLTRLDLRFNDITDEGARAVAESAALGNLTHLDLSFNRIGEEGAQALLEAVRNGPLSHLTSLQLDGNRVGHNLRREIARATIRGTDRGKRRGA